MTSSPSFILFFELAYLAALLLVLEVLTNSLEQQRRHFQQTANREGDELRAKYSKDNDSGDEVMRRGQIHNTAIASPMAL